MLKVYNSRITENPSDNVARYTLETPLVAGKTYTIKLKVHAVDITTPCMVRFVYIGDGEDNDTYVYGEDMTILPHTFPELTFTHIAKVNHGAFEFDMGSVIGNVYFDDVSCTPADDESINMVSNGDFETQSILGWDAPDFTAQTFSHAEDPYTELLEAADNTTWLSGNIESADIKICRTLQAGSWNTFCVPFNVSSSDLTAMGITAKELTGSTLEAVTGKLTLVFDDAESIVAGKPYLVKVDAEVENPTFESMSTSGTAVATETTNVDFIPSLGKTLVAGPTGEQSNTQAVLFLGANNTLYHPTVVNDATQEASYIKGFRAYFQLRGETTSQASVFTFDFGNGETTGIIPISNRPTATDDAIYDLQGRRINGLATIKGIYIINGKKVVIK